MEESLEPAVGPSADQSADESACDVDGGDRHHDPDHPDEEVVVPPSGDDGFLIRENQLGILGEVPRGDVRGGTELFHLVAGGHDSEPGSDLVSRQKIWTITYWMNLLMGWAIDRSIHR